MTTPVEGVTVTSQAPAEGFTPAEQAAIAKGQSGLSEVTPAPVAPAAGERPDYIPEKFWKDGKADLEGLAKSYAELERTRTPVPAEPAAAAPAEPAAAADPKVKVEATAAPQADSPLAVAMEAARTQWAETQEVSEESIAALEAAGIPREIFNVYLEGIKAQTAALATTLHGYTGGQEAFAAMTEWAGKNMSQAEADAYNAALDDPNLRENAVRGLFSRYSAATPNEGKLITPSGTPSASGEVFQNRDEFLNAQRDPRYRTDAAYRQSVMEKLARSQAVGSMGRVVDSGQFPRTIRSM